MRREFKEAEIEITKFTIAFSVETGLSNNTDYGELSLGQGERIEF